MAIWFVGESLARDPRRTDHCAIVFLHVFSIRVVREQKWTSPLPGMNGDPGPLPTLT